MRRRFALPTALAALALALPLCLPLATRALADDLCQAAADTALYADAALTEEVRVVFQFDGVQFRPQSVDKDSMAGEAFDVRMDPVSEGVVYARRADWTCAGDAAAEGAGAAAQTADAPAAADAGAEVFDLDPKACAEEMSDGRVVLMADQLQFYESACQIVQDQPGADGSRQLSLDCSGEGEEWKVEARLTRPDADHMTLGVDGADTTYTRCP